MAPESSFTVITLLIRLILVVLEAAECIGNKHLFILFNNVKYTCNLTNFSASPDPHSCTGLQNLLLPPIQLLKVASSQCPGSLLV